MSEAMHKPIAKAWPLDVVEWLTKAWYKLLVVLRLRRAPILDYDLGKKQGEVIHGQVLKQVAKDVQTLGRSGQRLRFHLAIEQRIGRGLTKGEWVGVAKKKVRQQMLDEGWFLRKNKQYFVNRAKVVGAFGPEVVPSA